MFKFILPESNLIGICDLLKLQVTENLVHATANACHIYGVEFCQCELSFQTPILCLSSLQSSSSLCIYYKTHLIDKQSKVK